MDNLFISNNSSNVNTKLSFAVKRKPVFATSYQINHTFKSISKAFARIKARKALATLEEYSNKTTKGLADRITKELNPEWFFNKHAQFFESIESKAKPNLPKPTFADVFQGLEEVDIELANQNIIPRHEAKRPLTPKEQAELDYSDFFSLVPEIQKSAVWWKIKNIFKNDVKAYIDSVPLFLKIFTKTMLHEANSTIKVDDKEKRKLKRRKKEALLASSQLLHLIGFKASEYINDSLLKYFNDDRQEQIDYITKTRLISSNGKFRKLTPLDVREKRKTAQILNVSDTISQIAQDRGWTFSFLTITLPACLHPNPLNGHNTFTGELPSKAHKRIHRFWQRIRAYLARYDLVAFDDYMGAMTAEAHKDSTLHLHVIIYHSKAHTLLVNKAVVAVSQNGEKKYKRSLDNMNKSISSIAFNEAKIQECLIELSNRRAKGLNFCGVDKAIQKRIDSYQAKIERLNHSADFYSKKAQHEKSEYNVNFDFKCSNGKAKGSTYLFKYIMKTTGSSMNSNATKNSAVRWFYSARAFSFFGVENSLSKFNFIIENKTKYLDLFSDHLKQCLKNHDYYTFLTVYTNFFEVIRDENGAIMFVKYDLKGNNAGQESFGLKPTADYDRQFVLIEKNIYNIVETNNNFFVDNKEITNIRKLEQADISNIEVFKAFDLVQQKQNDYNYSVENYKMKTHGQFITKASEQKLNSDMDSMKAYCVFDDLEVFDEECQQSFKQQAFELLTLKNNLFKNSGVTVDQSYSSKTGASKLAFSQLQKLRRENRVEYDKIIKQNHQKWLEDRRKPIPTSNIVSQTQPTVLVQPKQKLKFGLSK
ncbi:replication endonuclease [Burkholderia cepacia]|uniref:replication endonuclease n=1 Tax=Burkholderia cepacia TaxID=292 RepID=UPI001CF5A27B|nr:replication endonuclease [Burkholderia cepacia]MCA8079897.1 replication endonuclease [Burkholderia cepacia]